MLCPEIEVADVSGTIWQGRIDTLKYKNMQLEQLAWHIHPLSLLMLTLDMDVTVGSSKSLHSGKASLQLGVTGLRIQHAKLETQVEPLMKGLDKFTYGSGDYLNAKVSLIVQDYVHAVPFCQSLRGHVDTQDIDLAVALVMLN